MGLGIGHSDCSVAPLALCLAPREVVGKLQRLTESWKNSFIRVAERFWKPKAIVLKNLCSSGIKKGVGVNRRVWGTFPYSGFLLSVKMSSVWAVDQLIAGMLENWRYFTVISLGDFIAALIIWDKIKNILTVDSWRRGPSLPWLDITERSISREKRCGRYMQ